MKNDLAHRQRKYLLWLLLGAVLFLPALSWAQAGRWVHMGQQVFAKKTYNPSLVIDAAGTPYVAYRSDESGKVSVMKFDGMDWKYMGQPGSTSNASDYFSI